MKWHGVALVAVGLSVLAGCGEIVARAAHPNIVGHWEGRARLKPEEKQEPFSNLANGFAASCTLDLTDDHKFHLMAVVIPIDGTWEQKGDEVLLHATQVLGYRDNRPMGKTSTPATATETPSVTIQSNGPIHLRLDPNGSKLTPVDDKELDEFVFEKHPD